MYGPETFVVRVEGEAMAPRFQDGDYAWVDPDEPAADGCFVGVRVREAGPVVIRQLGLDKGRLVVRTLNPPRLERTLVGEDETLIEGVAVFVGRRP